MLLKNVILSLTLALGLTSAASAADAVKKPVVPAMTMGLNQKFEANGDPVEGKPGVLRSFIEFRTARGFTTEDFHDINGKPVNLSQFKDKLVLVDVWATWCEPCIRSLPAIKALQEKFNKEESDIRVVSIALDLKPARITKFIERHKFQGFQSWYDPEKNLSEALPLDVIPTFFILDGHGHSIGFVRGFVDWSDPAVVPYLEALAKKYAKRG